LAEREKLKVKSYKLQASSSYFQIPASGIPVFFLEAISKM
jgi:hypothetical protein